MVSDPPPVTGRRRSDPTLDPRVFAGLFGAVARGCLEFVTESIRVGGNLVGDLGDLVSEGADRAAGGLNERVDQRFDSIAPTAGATRRSSSGGSMRLGVADVVNRAVDGCVDVIESTARTFENVYNRQRRFDGAPRSSARSDVAPISGYDALTAEQVTDEIDSMNGVDDVRALLDYEERHKDRKTVVAAAQSRLTTLQTGATASASG